MLNPRRVLSKWQILQNVWRYDFGGNSNVVETYVSYLRRKLDSLGPPLIKTVRQAGYMLEAPGEVLGRLSLRARLVLGVLVLAAVGLVAADVATYASLRSFLFDRTDATLDTSHHAVEDAVRHASQSDDDITQLLPFAPGLYIQVRSQSGQILAVGAFVRLRGRKRRRCRSSRPNRSHRSRAAGSGPAHDRARYFTVDAVSGGDRYRVRASISPGTNVVLVIASSLGRRQHAAPAAPDRAPRHRDRPRRRSSRSGSGSCGSA